MAKKKRNIIVSKEYFTINQPYKRWTYGAYYAISPYLDSKLASIKAMHTKPAGVMLGKYVKN